MPAPFLGIDVGGTSIKGAIVSSTGAAEGERRIATPRDDPSGERTVEAIAGLVDEIASGVGAGLVGTGLVGTGLVGTGLVGAGRIGAVGVAVPGIVDEESGVVVDAVNLGWRDLPLGELLAKRLRAPVVFSQDVRTGAYAEAMRGAAADCQGVSVFLPIGTGIAAGIMIGRDPLVSGGWAGEVGQVEVSPSAERATLPSRSLEQVASASAIARRTGCADAAQAVALVRSGDRRATAVWNDAMAALAEALAWTTAVLGAEVIVIGGGLAGAGSLLLDPLGDQLRARLGVLRAPQLTLAAFGDRAAMVGAGLLARRLADNQRAPVTADAASGAVGV